MNQPQILKLLVVDDDPDDFQWLKGIMQTIPALKPWQIEWTDDYDQALDHMCSRDFHLFIIDIMLVNRSGLDLLKDAMEKNCLEPIIVLTGQTSDKLDDVALQQGAVDFLEKNGLTAEKLERSIRYAIAKNHTLQSLKLNENRFRQIFERSHDAIFIADEELKFQEVNPAMQTLLGFDKKELKEITLRDILPGLDHSAASELTDKEFTIYSSTGMEITCLLSTAHFTDLGGNKVIQGIFHNISMMRKAERANLMLEKLSANRRLAQYLAHEMRNPLMNIQLSMHQLKRLSTPEEVPFLDIIHRNKEKMNGIVDKLLRFSDSMESRFEKINAVELVRATLKDVNDRVMLQDIQVRLNFSAAEVFINGDAAKLKMALSNIITNAIEAMDKETSLLGISTSKESENSCSIKITDNGKGMEPLTQQRLFEPYFSTREDGTGLGLASALSIIESHKGSIEVRSLPGIGTTFQIYLPLA